MRPLITTVFFHSSVAIRSLKALQGQLRDSDALRLIEFSDGFDEFVSAAGGNPFIVIVNQAYAQRPGSGGLALARDQRCRVMVCADQHQPSPAETVALAEAGCYGLLKPTLTVASLRRALAAVSAGYAWFPRKAFGQLVQYRHASSTRGELSTRQSEILNLAAGGLSNKEISDRIGVSQQTIRWHLANLYAKTGIRNREQLALHARSQLRQTEAPVPMYQLPESQRVLIIQSVLSGEKATSFFAREPGWVVVRCPGSADYVAACARKFDAPVVVVDISLLDSCNAEGLGNYQDSCLGSRVIVSAPPDISFVRAQELLQWGCLGIVSRDSSPAQLWRAVRTVAEGLPWLSWLALSQVLTRLSLQAHRPPLSSREQQILELLSQGFDNRQISDRLFISRETLRWHMRNLYGKTGAADREELAESYTGDSPRRHHPVALIAAGETH